MKTLRIIILSVALLLSGGFVSAQNVQGKKWNVDISLSPSLNAQSVAGRVFSADVAVRYNFSPRFSAGIGIAPTYFNLIVDELFYAPIHLTCRYNVGLGEKMTPYVVLDAGGSFLQVEPDPTFQARLALGIDVPLGGQVSAFGEVGVAYSV